LLRPWLFGCSRIILSFIYHWINQEERAEKEWIKNSAWKHASSSSPAISYTPTSK
jgi:hypothetical protein